MKRKIELVAKSISTIESYLYDCFKADVMPASNCSNYGISGEYCHLEDVSLFWFNYIGSYKIEPNLELNKTHFITVKKGNLKYSVIRESLIASSDNALAFRELNTIDIAHNSEQAGLIMTDKIINRRLGLMLEREIVDPIKYDVKELKTARLKGFPTFIREMQYSSLIDMINTSARHSNVVRDFIVDSFLLNYPHCHTKWLVEPVPMIAPRQVKRALSYIHEHPLELISLEELSNVCGVGRTGQKLAKPVNQNQTKRFKP